MQIAPRRVAKERTRWTRNFPSLRRSTIFLHILHLTRFSDVRLSECIAVSVDIAVIRGGLVRRRVVHVSTRLHRLGMHFDAAENRSDLASRANERVPDRNITRQHIGVSGRDHFIEAHSFCRRVSHLQSPPASIAETR